MNEYRTSSQIHICAPNIEGMIQKRFKFEAAIKDNTQAKGKNKAQNQLLRKRNYYYKVITG